MAGFAMLITSRLKALLMLCVALFYQHRRTLATVASENLRPSLSRHNYLGLCVIVLDLRDFVDHYMALGVSNIHIFDHNSSTPAIKQFWDYAKAGIVEYHYIEDFILFNGEAIVQFEAYRQCIKKYAHRHQFLAFFDDNEYLVLSQAANTTSLPGFLRAYEGFGGLAVNWRIISSSGHTFMPLGRVDNYVQCLPQQHFQNTHVKVIANTKYVVAAHGSPHTFGYVGGANAVNENFLPAQSAFSDPVSTNKVALYHYTVKLREDFKRKLFWSIGAGGGKKRPDSWFDEIEASANETCTALQSRRKQDMRHE